MTATRRASLPSPTLVWMMALKLFYYHTVNLPLPITPVLIATPPPMPRTMGLGGRRGWQVDSPVSSQEPDDSSTSLYEKMSKKSSISVNVAVTVCFCLFCCQHCGIKVFCRSSEQYLLCAGYGRAQP